MIDLKNPLIISKAKEYALKGLEYFEEKEKGTILDKAMSNEDIAKEIAERYIVELSKLNAGIRKLLKWAVDNCDIYSFSRSMVDELVEELKKREGELGETARKYPEWLKDHMRRVFNLGVLYIREKL